MKRIVNQALTRERYQSAAGVERILDKKLDSTPASADFAAIWDLPAYGLERVKGLIEADSEAQSRVRHALARGRLLEAWAIEKAGMSYAAKMSLLAESINEQKLYSLFGAEEARHFHLIDQTLGGQIPAELTASDPFIALLNEIIATAARRPLIFVIQVVLEGWGIEHYAAMGKACRDDALKAVLREILSDEAAHHGSGLALFNEADLSRAERDYILEVMQVFLGMVRIGPVGVLGALETELGPWAPGQRARVLTEMDAEADTARKLALLEGFLVKAGAHGLRERLCDTKAFTPALI